MPSLVGVAMVLSYFGYKDEVRVLLCQLSKTTRVHFYDHRLNINSFVIVRPPPEKLPFFGREEPLDPTNCTYFEWPRNNAAERISREMRCNKFSIRACNNEALQGIQMHLSTGHLSNKNVKKLSSPSIRGKKNIQGTRKLEYTCNNDIKFVALRVNILAKGDQEYTGIRFLNDEQEYIVEEMWGTGLG